MCYINKYVSPDLDDGDVYKRQTGGYTKIGTIITADLPRLSQLPVGDGIHFDIVTINEAQDIYRSYMQQLQEWLQLAQEQSVYVFKVS